MHVFDFGRHLQLGFEPHRFADLRREHRLLFVARGREERIERIFLPLRVRRRDVLEPLRRALFRLRNIDLPRFEEAKTMLPVLGLRTRRGDDMFFRCREKNYVWQRKQCSLNTQRLHRVTYSTLNSLWI